MAKINSGNKLIDLMTQYGTGKEKLDFLYGTPKFHDGKPAGFVHVLNRVLFPRDAKKKNVICGDVHASEVIEALTAAMDLPQLADGHYPTSAITLQTLEKAKAIVATGKWVPPVGPNDGGLPIEFEDGEEEVEAEEVKPAKNKGGRPAKAKPETAIGTGE